jgi:hypothetical protein
MHENVYMAQAKSFIVEVKENLGCHLTKSIYGLKHASRLWYIKFDETIKKFGFKKNEEDNCIYAKFKNKNFIFLVFICGLHFAILVHLLLETKNFLSSHFDMKDIGEAYYVLGIEIYRDRRKGVLGLL